MQLKNKTVLITGSSKGIGKATALLFAKEGANIIVNYKSDENEAKNTINEIKSHSSNSIAVQADVAKQEEVKKMFTDIMKTFGTIDILINNAGLAIPKPFLELTRDDLISVFELNFFSAVYCSQEAAKIMLENKSGKIMNTCSTGAHTGFTGIAAYAAARAAVLNLTKSLAKVLAPDIMVNAVSPGYTKTDYWNNVAKETKDSCIQTTLTKKWITPDEIAQAFLYLAHNDSVTGQILTVDAGYTTNI